MSKIILLLLLFSFVTLKETKEDHLKATKHCQVNDPYIQAAATKLKKTTEIETAKNIFRAVQKYIDYEQYSDTKRGAVKTLKDKRGNCADQAHLLVALFRAAGIPARYVHAPGHYWTQCRVGDKIYDCDPTNSKHKFGKRADDGKKPDRYMIELKS